MVTQNNGGYNCRSVAGCDVVCSTSPEVRFHYIRDHADSEHPLDQAQWNNTRRGLSRWMDTWYQTQPKERQYTCEFDDCDKSNVVMSAAGLSTHYVFKHTQSPRASSAMQYAEKNGLLELMNMARNHNGVAVQSAPAPF